MKYVLVYSPQKYIKRCTEASLKWNETVRSS